MLSNTERLVLEQITRKIRRDAEFISDPALRGWARNLVLPLELLSDATHIYDRRERGLQLETARSLARE